MSSLSKYGRDAKSHTSMLKSLATIYVTVYC
jgi:hypothetical protein